MPRHRARRPGQSSGLCRDVHLMAEPREALRHGLHMDGAAQRAGDLLVNGGVENAHGSSARISTRVRFNTEWRRLLRQHREEFNTELTEFTEGRQDSPVLCRE